MGYYYKYAPEFTITRDILELTGFEYYHCTQTDPTPGWYEITMRYHQTILYTHEGISMDGGRYFTATPQYDLLDVKTPAVKLSYYIQNSETYVLFNFFNTKSLSKNDRLTQQKFLDIVPVFTSDQEKNEFWTYAAEHFWEKRKEIDHRFLPAFVAHLNNGQNISALEDEYLDALACVWMLSDCRKSKEERVHSD